MRESLDRYRTLVLDRTFRPMLAIGWERAVTLDLCERVEVLEYYDAVVRTARAAFPLPAVIRVKEFVRRRPRSVALTRRNVLARDRHRCQYCGTSPAVRELTIDHVLPRSKGGRTTWDNVVAACGTCNRRKGNRTPDEARMPLICAPVSPPFMIFERRGMFAEAPPREWRNYLPI